MPTQRIWRKERARERESPSPLAPVFICFFLLPLDLPYVNWASQECFCSTWGPHSSPQTFLCSIFQGFSLPCLLATAILDSFFLFYLPNTTNYTPLWLFRKHKEIWEQTNWDTFLVALIYGLIWKLCGYKISKRKWLWGLINLRNIYKMLFSPKSFHFHGNIQLQKLNYTTQEHSD